MTSNITNSAGNATRSAYLTVNQLGNDTMTTAHRTTGIAPLMKQLLADYAANGLPPAYLPLTTATTEPKEPT